MYEQIVKSLLFSLLVLEVPEFLFGEFKFFHFFLFFLLFLPFVLGHVGSRVVRRLGRLRPFRLCSLPSPRRGRHGLRRRRGFVAAR